MLINLSKVIPLFADGNNERNIASFFCYFYSREKSRASLADGAVTESAVLTQPPKILVSFNKLFRHSLSNGELNTIASSPDSNW